MMNNNNNLTGLNVALPPGSPPSTKRIYMTQKTPLFSSILVEAGNKKSLYSNMKLFLTKLLGPENEEERLLLTLLASIKKRSPITDPRMLHPMSQGSVPWHRSIPVQTPSNPFSTSGYAPWYHPTPVLRKLVEAPQDRKRSLGRELFSSILRTSG